ncbi:MAG: ABC transporter substrate-binding protein [Syntrophomonadaceae bacterium]|jgi:ABC-type nitrate/sulfonate/bicarbonate transport system substrate-binding protein|nr:ABC transporter substrate-binding protein [Syntrophomonadaceae bacterium]
MLKKIKRNLMYSKSNTEKEVHRKCFRSLVSAKNLLSAVVVLLLILATAGCSSNSSSEKPAETPGANTDSELFPVRAVTQTTFSETIIADKLGFFEDEGIKIEYIGTLGQGVSQYQALESGDIDVFTQGHLTDVALARLAGLTPVATAPGFVDDPNNPHVAYLVREDSDINSIEDFVGKKVGVIMLAVCTDGFITKYLTEKGLDAKSVEYVLLPQAGQAEQSLVNGQIDVTTSHTPFAGVALAAGGVRQVGKSYDIVGTPAGGLAVRGFKESFIKEHPDVVQGFANATYRARIFMEANPEYSKIVGAEYLGLKPEEVSSNSYCQEKNILPEWGQLWFDLSEELGYWEPGDIKPEESYTNQFVPKDPPASDAEIGK